MHVVFAGTCTNSIELVINCKKNITQNCTWLSLHWHARMHWHTLLHGHPLLHWHTLLHGHTRLHLHARLHHLGLWLPIRLSGIGLAISLTVWWLSSWLWIAGVALRRRGANRGITSCCSSKNIRNNQCKSTSPSTLTLTIAKLL